MNVFVSYLRQDNNVDSLDVAVRRIASLGDVYLDDLQDQVSVGSAERVVTELEKADAFVSIVTDRYLTTPWTKWEFGIALHRGIHRYALLLNGELVSPESALWPWSAEFEARLRHRADPAVPPPIPVVERGLRVRNPDV